MATIDERVIALEEAHENIITKTDTGLTAIQLQIELLDDKTDRMAKRLNTIYRWHRSMDKRFDALKQFLRSWRSENGRTD